jgi:hypothetical protein
MLTGAADADRGLVAGLKGALTGEKDGAGKAGSLAGFVGTRNTQQLIAGGAAAL